MNIENRNTTDEQVIEITNLKKGFGNQEVLKDISLKLFNGENLVVLGKSGVWPAPRHRRSPLTHLNLFLF